MKTIRVRVLKQFKLLSGILDEGDELDLKVITHTKKEIVSYKHVEKKEQVNGVEIKTYDKVPDLIHNIGDYKGFRFTAKNGQTYDEGSLRAAIGIYNLHEIFEKI